MFIPGGVFYLLIEATGWILTSAYVRIQSLNQNHILLRTGGSTGSASSELQFGAPCGRREAGGIVAGRDDRTCLARPNSQA